jgi:hypothetical protein
MPDLPSRAEDDGPDEVERFWLQVDENLARRRLRLSVEPAGALL